MGAILLVTGTDTGVGKTLATAILAVGLGRRGLRIGVAKPVETGCAERAGELYPADAASLAAAAASDEPLARICPHRFAEPLAPALAAARAGRTLDVATLARDLAARAASVDLLLVEGAGGLLVPLTPAASFADLAATVGAAVVVVVGSRLGAINHARLTLEVLAARGLPVRGYLVNQLAPVGDLAAATNRAVLAELTPVPCLGEVPWLADAAALLAALRAGGDEASAARARLATLAETLALDALAPLTPAS